MPRADLSVSASTDALSVTIPLPHFPRIPQQIAILAAVLAVFLVLMLLLKVFSRFRSIHKEDVGKIKAQKPQKQKQKKPDPHLVIEELQKALIAEMRGASRQNKIMIALTVVFITTSVLATIFSAQLNQFLSALPAKAPRLFVLFDSIFKR